MTLRLSRRETRDNALKFPPNQDEITVTLIFRFTVLFTRTKRVFKTLNSFSYGYKSVQFYVYRNFFFHYRARFTSRDEHYVKIARISSRPNQFYPRKTRLKLKMYLFIENV